MVGMGTAATAFALLCVAGCFSRPGLSRGDASGDDDAMAQSDGDVGFDSLPGGPYNVIFVTSDEKEIGMIGSVAAADAWCEQMSAGLPPNTYRAWMSSTTETVAMRIGSAQGWVRPDGRPVASTLAQLTAGNHLYPPRLDETGTDVTGLDPRIATGTNETGQLVENCADLDNRGLDFTFGRADAAAYFWTIAGENACDENGRLYCLGVDHSNALALPPDPSHRIAFISGQKYGVGSGIAVLDDACETEAIAASLQGDFRAALAVDGASIQSRFPAGAPWARRDGVVVIPSDMSTILAPIWLDAHGSPLTLLPDSAVVWTGATSFTQTNSTRTCDSWENSTSVFTSTTGFAVRGRALEAIGNSMTTCNTQQRVYCLQM
jgi:hypothetical protein